MSQNTRVWLHGLFAAFISAFSTAASGAIALPTVFNFTHDGLDNMLKLSFVPAAVAVFSYLKQSPLPGIIGPGDTATVKNPTISPDGTISGTTATLTKARTYFNDPYSPEAQQAPIAPKSQGVTP